MRRAGADWRGSGAFSCCLRKGRGPEFGPQDIPNRWHGVGSRLDSDRQSWRLAAPCLKSETDFAGPHPRARLLSGAPGYPAPPISATIRDSIPRTGHNSAGTAAPPAQFRPPGPSGDTWIRRLCALRRADRPLRDAPRCGHAPTIDWRSRATMRSCMETAWDSVKSSANATSSGLMRSAYQSSTNSRSAVFRSCRIIRCINALAEDAISPAASNIPADRDICEG